MIYLSSSCNKHDHLFDFLSFVSQKNIKHVELSGGSRYYQNVEEIIERSQAEHKIKFIFHNYFPTPEIPFILNFASTKKAVRQKSLDFAEKTIQLSDRFCSDIYTVHPGYSQDLRLSNDGEHFEAITTNHAVESTYMGYFKESVDELCRFAAKHHIKFGIENLFPENIHDNFSIMCTAAEFDWLFNCLGHHKNLGLLLDLGHAKLASNLLGFDLYDFLDRIMTRYRSRLWAIHISENDGFKDFHLVPDKKGWITDFMKNYRPLDVPITIEARNSNLEDVIAYYFFLQALLGI